MEAQSAPIIGVGRHRLLCDGQGVTTLVAFHGCPLRCKYCLNPQSLSPDTKVTHYDCATLYDKLKIDDLYFLATGGGVTFGGGEPCLRSDFIAEFRSLCGDRWRISIETSLNVDRTHLETLLPIVDHYIIDIKDINAQIYKDYTGKDNALVISNLQWLADRVESDRILIRIPLIEGYNTEKDQKSSLDYLKSLGLSQFDLFNYIIR